MVHGGTLVMVHENGDGDGDGPWGRVMVGWRW